MTPAAKVSEARKPVRRAVAVCPALCFSVGPKPDQPREHDIQQPPRQYDEGATARVTHPERTATRRRPELDQERSRLFSTRALERCERRRAQRTDVTVRPALDQA
jgi:hypothetical protein